MNGESKISGETILHLKGANIGYGSKVVLNDLDFSLSKGEKVALIGPSGAGKTTLLNKLYEMKADTAALIHQQYALVQQLTAFHNIYIGRLDRNSTAYNLLNLLVPQKKEKEVIAPIMERLGISEKIFEKVGRLSGGQQQRVAVGRAIYRGGDIVFADEPVSSVDIHQGEAILKLIMETEKTVVTSLHSKDFALQFASRIIGIREGEISFDLPAGDVTPALIDDLYRSC